MKYSNEIIIAKLKEYPTLKKKLRLLSFEMEHMVHITDEDMLQVMAQAISYREGMELRNTADLDKVMSIVLSYRERTAILNNEAFSTILFEVEKICRELSRIELYLNLLTESEKNILILSYVENLPWQELETRLGFSRRTIIRKRDVALTHMAELWSYSTNFMGK